MYAQPIAASAMAARMPPCTVPIGLACVASASSSTTASPGLNDASRMPILVAAGGGGASPRSIRSMPSSILAIAVLLERGAAVRPYIFALPCGRDHRTHPLHTGEARVRPAAVHDHGARADVGAPGVAAPRHRLGAGARRTRRLPHRRPRRRHRRRPSRLLPALRL